MRTIAVFSAALFVILSISGIKATAATRTVTNLNNNGAGSFRQAIIDANSGDKIVFAVGLNGAIHLASPLMLDKNLTINGPGANILNVEGRSEPSESRILSLVTSTVSISDLRIARGFSSGAGGGISVESGGNLRLNNCLIAGNEAESGGGIYASSGSLVTNTNSTILGNVAAVDGGGISNRDGARTVFHNNLGFGDFRVQYVAANCVNCPSGLKLVLDQQPDNFDPVWSPDWNSVAFSNDQLDLSDF